MLKDAMTPTAIPNKNARRASSGFDTMAMMPPMDVAIPANRLIVIAYVRPSGVCNAADTFPAPPLAPPPPPPDAKAENGDDDEDDDDDADAKERETAHKQANRAVHMTL